jgi:hypothetical protein
MLMLAMLMFAMLMFAMLMFAMLILGQRLPKPQKSIGFQNGGVDYHYSSIIYKRNSRRNRAFEKSKRY